MLEKTNDALPQNKRKRKIRKPRKKNDELLKGVLQENFFDFLSFVYPDADEIVDFEMGIDFMDKELFAILPRRTRTNDKRVADLLAKLYLKNGTEKWILLNVEIEGGNEAAFAHRMFQYNYRIRDRYGVSVAAIAVFIGNEKQARPNEYRDQLLGTTISFQYLTYHIFDDSQEVLLKKKNPFALIVLACRKALLEGKITDEELGRERLTIAKVLLSHNYDRHRIVGLILFLKNLIYINDDDINDVFDQQIEILTEKKINMSVLEILKMWERREGKLEGKREGKLEGKIEIVENLIVKLGCSDEQVIDVAKVSPTFVKRIRKKLAAKNNPLKEME